MTERRLVMPAKDRQTFLERLQRTLAALPEGQWDIVLEPHKRRRSLDQNALVWTLYEDILKQGGEELRGWTKDDLHEFMLGTHFGWDRMKAFGQVRLKPRRRSSRLTVNEFSDFLETIVRTMAEHGIVLQLPGDIAA